MSISKYQIFLKTVQCGNFSKAAQALNFTQSGVSHAVQALEDELDDVLDLLDELENELGIETYAVNCTLESLPPEERRETMFYLAVLSHIYGRQPPPSAACWGRSSPLI